jgi:hypothetical protein
MVSSGDIIEFSFAWFLDEINVDWVDSSCWICAWSLTASLAMFVATY